MVNHEHGGCIGQRPQEGYAIYYVFVDEASSVANHGSVKPGAEELLWDYAWVKAGHWQRSSLAWTVSFILCLRDDGKTGNGQMMSAPPLSAEPARNCTIVGGTWYVSANLRLFSKKS